MTDKDLDEIEIECPHCGQTYIGPADIPLPPICRYCGRVVEWIILDDEAEDEDDI